MHEVKSCKAPLIFFLKMGPSALVLVVGDQLYLLSVKLWMSSTNAQNIFYFRTEEAALSLKRTILVLQSNEKNLDRLLAVDCFYHWLPFRS